jgi:hypothetical protein
VETAATDLRGFGTGQAPTADVADLCRTLGGIPGTDPATLIAKLSPTRRPPSGHSRISSPRARALTETPLGVRDERG